MSRSDIIKGGTTDEASQERWSLWERGAPSVSLSYYCCWCFWEWSFSKIWSQWVEHPVVLIRSVLLPTALLLVLNHLESQWWRGMHRWIALHRVKSPPHSLVLPRYLSLPRSCSTVSCRCWLQKTSHFGCTMSHSIPLHHNATFFMQKNSPVLASLTGTPSIRGGFQWQLHCVICNDCWCK